MGTFDHESGGQVAGDVDDDGHLDLWYGPYLHRGPFLGRALRMEEDPVATVEDGGGAWLAGFDADGDGHEDVIFQDCCQTGWLHYGPFEGTLAGGRAEPPNPEITWFGDLSGCMEARGVALLPDYLGPGHPGVAIGIDYAGYCGPDTFVWDLLQPRGTHLGFETPQQLGYADSLGTDNPVLGAGDLDGDGFGEVIYGDWLYSWVLKGPLQGNAWYGTPTAFQVLEGHVTYPLGDLNGDGIAELLGVWVPDPYAHSEAFSMVLFSPYTDSVDMSQGLLLGHRLDLGDKVGESVADLDGDGLPDLVTTFEFGANHAPPPELLQAGEIRIWYGKDLLAAQQARLSLP